MMQGSSLSLYVPYRVSMLKYCINTSNSVIVSLSKLVLFFVNLSRYGAIRLFNASL